jgi:DNA polymerase-3 subunit delta'
MLKPAANALLKTLEEPPDRSVFFLLTSQPQGLLPTVLSRCQRLEVGRPGSQLDDELLARVHGMIEAAVSAARAGGAGKVEGLAGAAGLNEIIREIKERAEREIAAETGEEGENAGSDEAPLSKAEKGVAEARVGARYRELRVDMLRFINGWFRDMLVLSSVGPDAPILDDSRRKRILAASEGMSHADAMQCVRTFDEMTGLFETNMVEQVVLEKALLGLPAGPGLS